MDTPVKHPPPPSRAGSLALVAGDRALDFVNSESGIGFPSYQDHLQQPVDVVDWLEHAAVLDLPAAGRLRRRLAAEPALAAALLAEARRLRADLRAVATAIAGRGDPPQAALDDLAALHARWLAAARLAADGARRGWVWRIDDDPLAAALGPLALAAVRLAVERDPTRIKRCDGVACGWLFYDETKNRRRRWCEMEVCGNRAKQRRRAARGVRR